VFFFLHFQSFYSFKFVSYKNPTTETNFEAFIWQNN